MTTIETPISSSNHQRRATLSGLNIFLIVALLVQGALAAYMLWPRDSGVAMGVPLLGEIEPSGVTALTITEGEKSVSFEKANGAWVLAGTDGFPTTDGKVDETLTKILAIDGNRLVTQTANSHKRLQVANDDFVRKVAVTTSDGTQTLYVGSSAGSGATHVRLDGTDATYLTNQVASFELNSTASSWIDTQYFSLATSEVTAFTLENSNGTFTFQRGESPDGTSPGEWTLAELAAGDTLDQTKVNTLLSQAASLRMAAPVGKSEDAAYGLGSPSASVTFTVEEPVVPEESSGEEASGEGASDAPPETVTNTYTLQIGGTDEAGTDHYAKASNAEYTVLISQFNANQLIEKALTDFVTPPEEGGTDDAAGIVPTDSGSIFETLVLTDTVAPTETVEISGTNVITP